MGLSATLLLALSRDPADVSSTPEDEVEVEAALDRLLRVRPEFPEEIDGRDVLDFGCGKGRQAVAMALAGARRVVGLDIRPSVLEQGRELARRHGMESRVSFETEIERAAVPGFDWVVSQNSMEHFRQPVQALQDMRRVLARGGRILVTFSPTWLSPWGAHMHFFTPVPWVHLLFPERTVMRARSRFRDDGARRYEEVEGGLNRMTVAKFRRCVDAAELSVAEIRLGYVKDLAAFGRIPFVKEFFTNEVTAVLLPR